MLVMVVLVDMMVVEVENKALVLGILLSLTQVVLLMQIILVGDQQRHMYHGMMHIGLLVVEVEVLVVKSDQLLNWNCLELLLVHLQLMLELVVLVEQYNLLILEHLFLEKLDMLRLEQVSK